MSKSNKTHRPMSATPRPCRPLSSRPAPPSRCRPTWARGAAGRLRHRRRGAGGAVRRALPGPPAPLELLFDDRAARSLWAQVNWNYLGFPNGVEAAELRKLGREQAARFGACFYNGEVAAVRRSGGLFCIEVGPPSAPDEGARDKIAADAEHAAALGEQKVWQPRPFYATTSSLPPAWMTSSRNLWDATNVWAAPSSGASFAMATKPSASASSSWATTRRPSPQPSNCASSPTRSLWWRGDPASPCPLRAWPTCAARASKLSPPRSGLSQRDRLHQRAGSRRPGGDPAAA